MRFIAFIGSGHFLLYLIAVIKYNVIVIFLDVLERVKNWQIIVCKEELLFVKNIYFLIYL